MRSAVFCCNGSKARGDAHPESDIDLMLIVRNQAEDLKRVLRRLGYDLAATSWAVPSILARTEAEWARLKRGFVRRFLQLWSEMGSGFCEDG